MTDSIERESSRDFLDHIVALWWVNRGEVLSWNGEWHIPVRSNTWGEWTRGQRVNDRFPPELKHNSIFYIVSPRHVNRASNNITCHLLGNGIKRLWKPSCSNSESPKSRCQGNVQHGQDTREVTAWATWGRNDTPGRHLGVIFPVCVWACVRVCACVSPLGKSADWAKFVEIWNQAPGAHPKALFHQIVLNVFLQGKLICDYLHVLPRFQEVVGVTYWNGIWLYWLQGLQNHDFNVLQILEEILFIL